MIKVIEKTFAILALVSSRGKASLAEIAAETGENKTTAANILRSLLDLGQLAKDEMNNYSLGPALLALSMSEQKRSTLSGIAQGTAQDLSEAIREAVVIAVLDGNERFTIAEGNAGQGIMVNANLYKAGSVYNTATGRVLLSMLDKEALAAFIRVNGLPESGEWPEAVTSKKLEKALARIRKEGMESMTTGSGDVQALAVPVMDARGNCIASVGTYLPLMRFSGSHRDAVIDSIKKAGAKMTRRLSLL